MKQIKNAGDDFAETVKGNITKPLWLIHPGSLQTGLAR